MSNKVLPQRVDVVIVGGGLAGLTAARELSGRGLSIVIVEARDRIGGRTWFQEWQGQPIEMGGGWVYWTQPHVWAEITRYNLQLFSRPGWPTNYDAPIYALVNGEVIANPMAENMAMLFGLVEQYADVAQQVFPRPFDPQTSMEQIAQVDHLSSADRLDQMALTPLQRVLLDRLMGMQAHNDPSQGAYVEFLRWYALSRFDMEAYLSAASRYQFTEGTQALANALLNDSEADVHLNSPVAAVHQDADGVTVTLEGGEAVSAEKAILSLPINVLNKIDFSPPLNAAKQSLSSERHSGAGQKIYVKVAGHWPDLNCAANGDALISTVLVQEAWDDETLLVVFALNDKLLPISKESLEKALQQFVPEIKVLDFTHHDWVADPYALGTWCGFRPNQTSKYLQQAQASEGHLHFAGSDIANGWRGFMDGAIESGLRAAREIKQLT